MNVIVPAHSPHPLTPADSNGAAPDATGSTRGGALQLYIRPDQFWANASLSPQQPGIHWWKNPWHDGGYYSPNHIPTGGHMPAQWDHGIRSPWIGRVEHLKEQWRHISFGPYVSLPSQPVELVFFLGFVQLNDPDFKIVVLDASHGGTQIHPTAEIYAHDGAWTPGINGIRLGIFSLVVQGGPEFNARVLYTGKANIYHFLTKVFY